MKRRNRTVLSSSYCGGDEDSSKKREGDFEDGKMVRIGTLQNGQTSVMLLLMRLRYNIRVIQRFPPNVRIHIFIISPCHASIQKPHDEQNQISTGRSTYQ
jgi:hypothetical protein